MVRCVKCGSDIEHFKYHTTGVEYGEVRLVKGELKWSAKGFEPTKFSGVVENVFMCPDCGSKINALGVDEVRSFLKDAEEVQGGLKERK